MAGIGQLGVSVRDPLLTTSAGSQIVASEFQVNLPGLAEETFSGLGKLPDLVDVAEQVG